MRTAEQQNALNTARISSTERLPQIDLHPWLFGDRAARLQVARRIADACARYGFFYLYRHNVPDALRQGGFEAAERFFAMPVDKRMACRPTAARQIRGYQPLGDTKRPGIPADLKESFDMGFPLAADDPDVLAGLPFHSTNSWPADLPGFRRAIEALYFSKLECGRHVLRAMALALGADENFFVGQCEKPYTNMRLVHYPPQDPQPDAGIGASAHSDRGIITLLLNDSNGGLHVETANGDWIDAPPDPQAIIVNVGDLMTRWSNGRFRSAIHRVVNETGHERYSIPQFHHPSYRAVVDPAQLPGAGTIRYEPVVAGEFVAHGLQRDRKSWSEAAAETAPAA
ncbi:MULTISPECIES: isopenicillin N synthase family dioxygenase [Ramlibacter]|uniref:Isopenicillin N synthase family oxygenase n=1 Tax=Ramlibacter pinisoli TaxID=2682844 RepID=A0A6N8IQP8_9BURK|nr:MULTISPECIES: 2OG-Fe(II) oxygenase family protein [Ramlibacter]MBA2964076.1 isopenicillin N synthase family oxygenase [Ramlibacter sp. CGMCC 1.13660]MVQ29042.1 isopenicillin N synthase family oxygenase [Ramlibacter pinisoli]